MARLSIIVASLLVAFTGLAGAQVFPSGSVSNPGVRSNLENLPAPNSSENGRFSSGSNARLGNFPDDPRIRITISVPKPSSKNVPIEPRVSDVSAAKKTIPTPNVSASPTQSAVPVASPIISQGNLVPATCFNGVRLQWFSPVPVAWDMGSDIKTITALNDRYDSSASKAGYDSLGVTKARLSLSHKRVVAPNGCGEIHVGLGYTEMEIKIARELSPNACAVEHVRTHELKHVAIYQAWTEKMQRELPEKISYYLLKNPNPTSDMVANYVQSEWLNVRALHENLDSPDEYRENEYACNRAIPRLLRNVSSR